MTQLPFSDVAARHGWSVTRSGKGSPTYLFVKGDLRVSYCRKGRGSVSISYKDHHVWFDAVRDLRDADGVVLHPMKSPPEVYVEALLCATVEERAVTDVERYLRDRVKHAHEALARAEKELTTFLKGAKCPTAIPSLPI